jgi:GNAT superfamily N-acetyltransferase
MKGQDQKGWAGALVCCKRAICLSFLGGVALAVGAYVYQRRRRTDRSPRSYVYHRGYRETITLRNGVKVRLRLVRPGDKRLLAAGMRHLSAESRQRRFHATKAALSETELRYLTEVDGENHFALGALRWPGGGEGLGVARFVRLPNDPTTAEAAIVVVDAAQRLGLGQLLFTRLIQAARERGITTLRCELQSSNTPALRLLESVAPRLRKRLEGATLHVEIPTEPAAY